MNTKVNLIFTNEEGEVVNELSKEGVSPNEVMAALMFLAPGSEIVVKRIVIKDEKA